MRIAAIVLVALIAPLAVTLEPDPADADGRTTYIYKGAGRVPRIGLIGDSSLSGVRWSGTYGDLYEHNFVFDAESCRRTLYVSCRGREGYAPENALQTLRRLSGRWGRVLVMMTGYNDPGHQFDEAVDAIVREAKRQGIPNVMWLTMRTADVGYVSPEFESDAYTFRDNNRILLQKAVKYRGYLQIADWATYSAQQSSWVTPDGVHVTVAGGFALTSFITDQADLVIGGRTVTPPPNPRVLSGWVPVRKGDYGGRVARVQQALINRGIQVVGGADGVFGTYTERAVKTFQRRKGMRQTGVVGEPTAIRLGLFERPPRLGSLNCTVSVTLRKGDRLDQVRCLERHLAARGYRLPVNSGYGGLTAAAIRYFKTVSGLRPDGVAGPHVLAALGIHRKPPPRPDCEVWRQLRPGERLPSVRCLKAHLRARGYTTPASANYGVGTKAAIRHFRRKAGLGPGTTATIATLRAMRIYREPAPRPGCKVPVTLRSGDRSAAVRCFKLHLRSRGFGVGKTMAFDPKVAMVVHYLRPRLGLRGGWVAGPSMLRAMRIYDEPGRTRNDDTPSTATTTPPTTIATPPPTSTTTTPPTTTPPTTTPPSATTIASSTTTVTSTPVPTTSAPSATTAPPSSTTSSTPPGTTVASSAAPTTSS